MVTQQINDFLILGPAIGSGDKVLDAVHALYFLPDNFKLILTGGKNTDQSFYDEVKSLVERDELTNRVNFDGDLDSAQVIILPNLGMSRSPNTVSGDSPEALASAILKIARA